MAASLKKVQELDKLLKVSQYDRKINFGRRDASIEFGTANSSLIISGSNSGIAMSGSGIYVDATTVVAGSAADTNSFLALDSANKIVKTAGTTITTFTSDRTISDDVKLIFGNDGDAFIKYNETISNKLIISGAGGGTYFSGSSIHIGPLGANGSLYAPALTTPVTALDVITDLTIAGTGLGAPITQIVDGQGGGEMIKISTFHSSVNTKGQVIYYYGGGAAWLPADRSSATDSTSLLAVALDVDGGADEGLVLLRGICRIPSTLMDTTSSPGAGNSGAPIYLSTTAGKYTVAVSSTNNDYVRIVGHILDSDGTDFLIYFNPSNDWVKVTA